MAGKLYLALGLGISIVSTVHLPVAGEARLRHLGEDGIVLAGDAGHRLLQHGEVVIAARRAGGCALPQYLQVSPRLERDKKRD